MEALGGNKGLLAELVPVGVAEDDTGKGSTTTRSNFVINTRKVVYWIHANAPASIVDDLLHNTPNVAVTLREVEGTELGRRLVVVGVRLELEIARDV